MRIVTTMLRPSAAQRSPWSMARRNTPHWTSWGKNGLAPGWTAAFGVDSARMSVTHTGTSTGSATPTSTTYQKKVASGDRLGAAGGASGRGPALPTPGSSGPGSLSSASSIAIAHPPVEDEELAEGHDE